MIDVAVDAAKQAGALALKYFKNLPKVEYKPDSTPVTRADREVEMLIRKIISQKFPDHGIIGEEFEAKNPLAPLKWIIDPIDGTKDFVRHLPFWGNYIAVIKNSIPILGIAFYPVTNEMFIAQKNKGAFLNNKKLRVSKTAKIEEASMTHGSINILREKDYLEGFLKLYSTIQTRRAIGSYGFGQFLKGNIDIELETGGGIYDFAAPAILVEEAGGKFTDFSGKFSITSGNCIATNGLLHKEVIKILNEK